MTGATNVDHDVRIIGHRGCADQYPENTVLAVTHSAPHVDAIEVDVRQCASGELVVFHDETLDRLTRESGPVATTDWETLRELSVLGSDQSIPRLSTVLEAVPADTAINIEFKQRGIVDDVRSVTDDVDNDIFYSSFLSAPLRAVGDADPSVDCGLLIDDTSESPIRAAIDLGCTAIHPSYETVLGTDLVETADSNGLTVNAWTIPDTETAAAVARAGVDGLIVDRWDLF